MSYAGWLSRLIAVLALVACSSLGEQKAAVLASVASANREYRLIAASGGGLALVEAGRGGNDDRELLRIAAIEIKRFEPRVDMLFGFFTFARESESRQELTITPDKNTFVLADSEENYAGSLELRLSPAGAPEMVLTLDPSIGADAVLVSFVCDPDARLWGMGVQYNHRSGPHASYRLPVKLRCKEAPFLSA